MWDGTGWANTCKWGPSGERKIDKRNEEGEEQKH